MLVLISVNNNIIGNAKISVSCVFSFGINGRSDIRDNRIFVVQLRKKNENAFEKKFNRAFCSPSFSECALKICQLIDAFWLRKRKRPFDFPKTLKLIRKWRRVQHK
jgi:hypothetical protein